MTRLIIEKSTFGSSESEIILLTDQLNKRSTYVYTNEGNFEDWVKKEAKAYKENGYTIVNNTNINLKEI